MLNSVRRHIPALFTAMVWGSTFVASKRVLSAGIEPQVLMMFRFALAYLLLWCVCHKRLPIRFNRLELKFALLGIAGGSLYFLTEYLALQRTSAVNVGLISSTVSIAAMGMAILLGRARINRWFVVGSALALGGVFFVVTNGNFALQIFPTGDAIAISSMILWAAYTVILNTIGDGVDPLLVSRRLFFYALITLLPFVVLTADLGQFGRLLGEPELLLPAAYLGVFASAVCIWLWNISVNTIGLQKTNNYLYLMPVITVIASAIFAGDEISIYNIIGSILIVIGIIIADRRVQTIE